MGYENEPRVIAFGATRTGPEQPTDDKASLAAVELFQRLDPEAVREIASRCQWHRYAENERVFDSECRSRDVYFIVSGSVRIVLYSGSEQEIALANFPAGDYFGEMSALDEEIRAADAYATSDTLLASLSRAEFIDTLLKYPQLSLKVMKRLIRIIRLLDNRVAAPSAPTPTQRVYLELLHLAEPAIRPGGTWGIRNMPNHREIAIAVGATPDLVAQAIGHLVREGIVERQHKTLYILDRIRLRQLSQDAESEPVF